ncbi:MAG: SRPBCC family protein [Gemmatimonadaceae bacterium]
MRRWLRLWFTFEERVGRREYVVSGLALALIKYAGDALLVWAVAGQVWTPVDYLTTVHSVLSSRFAGSPRWLGPALAAWSLPFMWIGFSMSLRRALDAGRTAWLSLLFLIPYVTYALIAMLSILPTAALPRRVAALVPRAHERRLPSALLSIAAGVGVALAMVTLSILAFRSYGVALFLSTPFVTGVITGFLLNRRYPARARETREVVAMTILATAGALILTAIEGGLCVLMAAPLALPIAVLGGAAGRHIALRDRSRNVNALAALAVVPVVASTDATRGPTPLREVRSAVEIDAPPDVVWRHVIAFPPLAEPPALVFRLGVAYPLRAEIVGRGVGAVRHCVFSTGAFVEPITVWEPGRRVSFDVAAQPPPLHEWSPYAGVVPPHLDGYFRSRRGEFRLVPLAGGRTRLEGSTWYEMRLYPEAYWVLFADALVSGIHRRVLRHVQTLAEAD